MSTTSDLMTGCATYLAAQGVCVYPPTGVYAATDTGIAWLRLPQTPNRCLALSDYAISDHPTQSLSKVGLQVLIRGNPSDALDAEALRDAVFNALQGLSRVQWGSVWLIQSLRHHSVPMGQDDNLRFVYSDSYYLDINPAPNAYRTQ